MSVAHSARGNGDRHHFRRTKWCLSPLSLALVLCGWACSAEDAAREPGPWLEVSLKDPAEKVTGFLLQSENGTLTLVQEKDRATRDFAAARVETLNFERPPAPPPKKDLTKTAEAPPETKGTETRKKEDTPKEPFDRPPLGERLPRRELWKKRALERLTPEERKRLEELMERFVGERKDLAQGDEAELKRLYEKLGLPDPIEYRQQVHQAMRDARVAQFTGKMEGYVQAHQDKLRQAATEEERRKLTLGLFAAAYVQNTPPDKFLPRIAEALRQSDPRLREKPPEKLAESLREGYEVFAMEAKRPPMDKPPLGPWRPRLGDKPKAP
jgi:hypothetical protein